MYRWVYLEEQSTSLSNLGTKLTLSGRTMEAQSKGLDLWFSLGFRVAHVSMIAVCFH